MLEHGPTMLRNMLGPMLNTTLDQILTYLSLHFLLFLAWLKPVLSQFFSKNEIFKDTPKRKAILRMSTTVLTALFEMSSFVYFPLFGFWKLPIFGELLFDGLQKSNNAKFPQEEQETKCSLVSENKKTTHTQTT